MYLIISVSLKTLMSGSKMTDAAMLLTKWREHLTRGKEHDTWGQFVEASEEYGKLSQQLLKQLAPELTFFNEEQKKLLGKIAACLHLRSRFLQNLQGEEISLKDVGELFGVLDSILSEEVKSFPIKIDLPEQLYQTNSSLILEDENHNDQDNAKELGTLLPRIPFEAGCHRLTIKIVKVGLKEPFEYINPFITVSVKGINGADITPSQNTSAAKTKENRYIHFDCNVEIQTTIEKLPDAAAIFFEFKHFKPKKKRISTKCWSFMEMDEIQAGPGCLELYKKPTSYCRKKLSLLTVKSLYLHIFLTINDQVE